MRAIVALGYEAVCALVPYAIASGVNAHRSQVSARRKQTSASKQPSMWAHRLAVALFGIDLNAAGMNTIVGFVCDMLYGRSGGYPSYASAAAVILFAIVLTITCINLLVSKRHVHYV